MNEELKQEILAYLYNRHIKVSDTLNSQYIHMFAKKMGKMFPLFNNELIDEKHKLEELINRLENYI